MFKTICAGQRATCSLGAVALTAVFWIGAIYPAHGDVVAWGAAYGPTNAAPALTNVVALSGGLSHNLALQDGKVFAWGSNTFHALEVPASLTKVTAVAAGERQNLALQADRTVVAWGDDWGGKMGIPPGLTNVVAIATRFAHSLALRADGTVVAWGDNTYGQTNVPAGLSNVVAIAAGRQHSLALRADGTVVAWGDSFTGQTNVPAGLSQVVAIAAGNQHSLALQVDGTVVEWGGYASAGGFVPTNLSPVIAIAAGDFHNLALKPDGTVVAWGANYDGQAQVPSGLTNVVAVAAGWYHSLALTGEGLPFLVTPLVSRTVQVGGVSLFHVDVVGTRPFNYQWTYNGTNLPGATAATLMLTNVQPDQAGEYSVVVFNRYGGFGTHSATLTVDVVPACVAAPKGLLAWWPAEGSGRESVGRNDGTLMRGVTFQPGMVGQSFEFHGTNEYVVVPDSPALNPAGGLTIEAWVRLSEVPYPWLTVLSKGDGHGIPEYELGVLGTFDGRALLRGSFACSNSVAYLGPTNAIPRGVWTHVAMTYDGSYCCWYINGKLEAMAPTGGQLQTNSLPLYIGGEPYSEFHGGIDEVSIYDHALSPVELMAIYRAGSAGKCAVPEPPLILSQPQAATVSLGSDATFTVVVQSSAADPLAFQWQWNGTDLPGMTNQTLVLPNVQFDQRGVYSVVVSNSAGSVTSTPAVLTVIQTNCCTETPSGLIGWWRGEGDTSDEYTGAQGLVPCGLMEYGPGLAGRGFALDGICGGVHLGNPPHLQVSNLTIEAWIRRSSASVVSRDAAASYAHLFGYDKGGYKLCLDQAGRPFLGMTDRGGVSPNVNIADTKFHHVVVTKSGSEIGFYVDGVCSVQMEFGPGFDFEGTVWLGGHITNEVFYGSIDELAVYSRALAPDEIQAIYRAGSAGKCLTPLPPFIQTQPVSQTVVAGSTVLMSSTARGTAPLSYQWQLNGTDIPGATQNSLILTNLQLSQAGNYSVAVSNAAGAVVSSNALLTVTAPPAVVQVPGGAVDSGGVVTIPIQLVANGGENAVGFSLNFPPGTLKYLDINPGSAASTATLLVNSSQVSSGWLGIALALPVGATFPAGTQEIVQISFSIPALINGTSAFLSFGDVPTRRQVVDANAAVLPATFAGGAWLIAAAGYEGDVAPRAAGDKEVTIADWVQLGRFASRLDFPTNFNEFRRVDCAPRGTLGDGVIGLADWVQAGRYTIGLDPRTLAGGPGSPTSVGVLSGHTARVQSNGSPCARRIAILNGFSAPDQLAAIAVNLEAQGDESALAFSLSFDPKVFTYRTTVAGRDAAGANLNVNTTQADVGRVAFALAFPPGSRGFSAGARELVKVTFQTAASASGKYPISLDDQPVAREICNSDASTLESSYVNGSITIDPRPKLSITQSNRHLTLSWPLWSTNAVLQETSDASPSSAIWKTVPAETSITNEGRTVTLPLNDGTKFYRLYRP